MPATTVEEMELVTRARSGDVAAFGEIVRRYTARVYNLAYRLTGNAEDAADAAQEAFIAAYEGLEHFRGESAFFTWLYRIAVNKALRGRRMRESRREFAADSGEDGFFDGVPDGGDGPAARIEAAERAEAVAAAVAALPEDFRAVVVLKDIEGLEYEAIAEVLAIPVGTVKSRLSRGRMQLRDSLRPWLGATQ